MANIQHSSLTGADLHECKGADAALVGTVPVATGSGTAIFQPLNYSYLTGKPLVANTSFNGIPLTSQPIIKHYQFNAVAGAFSQALSGFTAIHSVQVKCISPAAGGSPVDVILTSQSTSTITGQIVDFAGALVAASTALVFLTVHGV